MNLVMSSSKFKLVGECGEVLCQPFSQDIFLLEPSAAQYLMNIQTVQEVNVNRNVSNLSK